MHRRNWFRPWVSILVVMSILFAVGAAAEEDDDREKKKKTNYTVSRRVAKQLTPALEALKTALNGTDAAEIKAKSEALTQTSMKMGEALYKAAQAEAENQAASGTDSSQSGEDVVDADFEEVDDDKKDQDKSA